MFLATHYFFPFSEHTDWEEFDKLVLLTSASPHKDLDKNKPMYHVH